MVAMLDMLLEHDTKLMGNTEKELMFPALLERAWDKFEDYKIKLFDGMLVAQDKLVSLLRAINTDLGQADLNDEEEDQLLLSASANTTDTMSSTLSVLRTGIGYSFLLVEAFTPGECI